MTAFSDLLKGAKEIRQGTTDKIKKDQPVQSAALPEETAITETEVVKPAEQEVQAPRESVFNKMLKQQQEQGFQENVEQAVHQQDLNEGLFPEAQQQGQDFLKILINNAGLGMTDELMGLIKGSVSGDIPGEILKEQQSLAAARRRAGKRSKSGVISDETVADIFGFAVAGLAPEVAMAKQATKYGLKTSVSTIAKLNEKLGPDEAAMVLRQLPMKFGKGISGDAARGVQLVLEGTASGGGYSQAQDLETLINGLGSGFAMSTLLGAGLKAVNYAGGKITGLSDEGGRAVYRHAKKSGLDLSDRAVKDQIISNFVDATDSVEATLKNYQKNILGPQRAEVLAANANTKVDIGNLFGETINDLKSALQKETNEDVRKQIQNTINKVENEYKAIRIKEQAGFETTPNPLAPAQPYKTDIKKFKPTNQAEFGALDDYKQTTQREIFADKQYRKSPKLQNIMEKHQSRIAKSLEKVDTTGNLAGINDVYVGTYKAQNEMPTVSQFLSNSKGTTSGAAKKARKEFEKGLSGIDTKNLEKYAPDLHADVYSKLGGAYSDVVALDRYEKAGVFLPVVGSVGSRLEIPQKLGQFSQAAPEVLGQAIPVGPAGEKVAKFLGAAGKGFVRRAGGEDGSQSLPSAGDVIKSFPHSLGQKP